MIREMIASCVFARFGRAMGRIWRESVLRQLLLFLLGQARCSAVGWALFGDHPGWRSGSLCYRLCDRFDGWLLRTGERVRPWLEGFCLARLWRWLSARNAVDGSLLLGGLVFRPGFKRVFLGLFALYLPLDEGLRTLPLPSLIPSLWDEAFLLLGLGYALFRPLSLQDRVRPRLSGMGCTILLFCCLNVLLLGFVSPVLSVGISGMRAVIQYMLWFYVVVRLLDDAEDVKTLIKVFVFLGTALGLHGIFQYIIGVEIPTSWVSHTEVGVRTRAFSIVGSPNILGDLMVLFAPLAASLAYAAKSWKERIFYWGCVGVMGVCCLVTFSRGAWVGFAVAVLIFALLRDRRLLLVMLAVFAVAMCIPEIYNRLMYLFTPEFAYASNKGGRGSRWAIGLHLLYNRADPLVGFGLGRFGGAVAMQNQTEAGIQYFYMDNYYLKTLVEMGYLGLSGYILTLAAAVIGGLRAYTRAKISALKDISVGALSAMCGVMTHCFFENIFEVPYMTAYFWGLAAVLTWIGLHPAGKRAK